MKLREYQSRAIADLRASYAAGHRAPCLVLPTGGGKTIIAAAVVRGALERSNRVLFLAHRTELLEQTVRKLENAGITDVRLIRASSDLGNPNAAVTVASIPTLTRWKDRMPKADLVVFDECHHVIASTWQSIADQYSGARLLGLSATPQRADGKPLGDVFDALVVGATVQELTTLGHLVPCRVWAPPDQLDTGELGMEPLAAYQRFADGERAVVFCTTLEHARSVAQEFHDAGIASGVVHGGLAGALRGDVLKRFETGAIRVVCNVYVLTEGWDCPAAVACIIARKPQHAGTFLQMVGRVLRPSEGKTHALLLDLAGSVHVHGTPDCERTYTLDGKGISKSDRLPLRQCPTCGAVFMLGATSCPMCGCELPRHLTEAPRSIGTGLAEVGPAKPPRVVTIAITAKFPSVCRKCRGVIHAGERVYWTKGEKRQQHATCGSTEAMAEANRLMTEAG